MKLMLLTVFVSWIFFAFMSILKADRFIIPIFPYLAILSASVFDWVKNKKMKIALIFITVILSLGQFLGGVWGKGPMKATFAHINIPLPFHQRIPIYFTSVSHPPYIYRISGKEIVDYLVQDSKKSNFKNPQVLSLFYYHFLDDPIISWNLYHQIKPLTMVNFLGTVITVSPSSTAFMTNMALKSNYVLLKSGRAVDKSFSENNYQVLRGFIELFNTNPSLLQEYYDKKTTFWIYQDSSQITVYKKKKEFSPETLETMRQKLSDILTSQQAASSTK